MGKRKSTEAQHNWLVYRIVSIAIEQAAATYASGRLIDVGCGRKPWLSVFEPYVDEYVGVDHVGTQHDISMADVVADAYDTTLEDATADTVILLAVLEHLEEPGLAVAETARVLRPGGHLILTAPMFWHEHEAPRDFFRYTQFGLRHLAEKAGLDVVEIKPLSGFFVTFAQELCYVLLPFTHRRRRVIRPLARAGIYLIQRMAYALRRWDTNTQFAWMHLLVARKPIAV